jgi:hypothetical protein
VSDVDGDVGIAFAVASGSVCVVVEARGCGRERCRGAGLSRSRVSRNVNSDASFRQLQVDPPRGPSKWAVDECSQDGPVCSQVFSGKGEREKKGRDARYADAELGLARYRRHPVVHIGGETGKAVQVRHIHRR